MLAAIDPLHAFAKPAGLDAEVLEAGAQVSDALGGRLHAMHSFNATPLATTQLIGASASVVSEIAAARQSQARQAFDRALRKTRIPRSRRHLRLGQATEAIPRTARALRAGIVVMGAVSRSALRRFVIGNTAERILGDLQCDVLVVKPAAFRDARVAQPSRRPLHGLERRRRCPSDGRSFVPVGLPAFSPAAGDYAVVGCRPLRPFPAIAYNKLHERLPDETPQVSLGARHVSCCCSWPRA